VNITKQFLATIAPVVSGKYSKNLHAWLRVRIGQNVVAYAADGGTVYLSTLFDEGWLHGSQLMRVLTRGARETVWAYPPKHILDPLLLPDFWVDYERIGVCAIDKEHRWYSERWDEQGDTRTCRWCGLAQSRVKWAETVQRERWETGEVAT
jgi:hypothetical protein